MADLMLMLQGSEYRLGITSKIFSEHLVMEVLFYAQYSVRLSFDMI